MSRVIEIKYLETVNGCHKQHVVMTHHISL